MAMDAEGHHVHEELLHHESDERGARTVALVTAGIVAVLAVCVVALISIVQWFAQGERLHKNDVPFPELQAQRAYEQQTLGAWRWVDREAGVARVPVERAAALYLEYGAPAERAAARAGD
ncbi:MAG: hypothetical protein KatS3mg102_1985 [Planctomycetota bacterium]|nr:MAG: hypothetical protein KatS3mg102_1985 [Planctomycetota bacterium]